MNATIGAICVIAALLGLGPAQAFGGEDPLAGARRLREAGQCPRAVERYEGVIAADPSQTDPYRGLVLCHEALGDPEGALAFLETVYLEHPGQAGVLYGLGYALFRARKYEKALGYFEKAVERRPDLAEAWNNCAVIHHFVRKDYEKARACYKKAVRLAKAQGDRRVLGIAQENLSHLPEPLRPCTEPLTLKGFLDRAMAAAEARDRRRIRELVLGQKENTQRAVDWLVQEALEAWGKGGGSEEENALLMARVLGTHYREAFGAEGPMRRVKAYEGLTPREKGRWVRAERHWKAALGKGQKGLWAEAARAYREAASAYEGLGESRRAGCAWKGLGDARRSLRAYAEAARAYGRALDQLEAAGEEAEAARVLSALGITWYHLGDSARARRFFQRSLDAFGRLKDEAGAGLVRRNLSRLEEKQRTP